MALFLILLLYCLEFKMNETETNYRSWISDLIHFSHSFYSKQRYACLFSEMISISAISLHLIFIGIQSTDQHFRPILFPLFLLDLHSGALAQSNSSRKWKSVSNWMKFLFSKMTSRKTVQWMDGSNYFNRLKCLFIRTALLKNRLSKMLVHFCVSWKAIWQIKCWLICRMCSE